MLALCISGSKRGGTKADVAAARGVEEEMEVEEVPSPAIDGMLVPVSNRMRARLSEVWADRGASVGPGGSLVVAAVVAMVKRWVMVFVLLYMVV
mmetsp:Transcript_23972/g.50185  ORF Transcript_23972/g.50185 Transcript_23972/m.50185 type:complete len:94 (-) Transcript_23972:14-295(-)